MKIDSIKNGIVIDHIAPGKALQLYNLLGLEHLDCPVALLQNVSSRKMGKKDLIKLDGCLDCNLDAVGYVSPNATVNIIRDGKLVEKKHIALPQELTNLIHCKNPRCITQTEPGIAHTFVLSDEKTAQYRCLYCDTPAN